MLPSPTGDVFGACTLLIGRWSCVIEFPPLHLPDSILSQVKLIRKINSWTNINVIRTTKNYRTIFGKNLAHVLSEHWGEKFMTPSAANHPGGTWRYFGLTSGELAWGTSQFYLIFPRSSFINWIGSGSGSPSYTLSHSSYFCSATRGGRH